MVILSLALNSCKKETATSSSIDQMKALTLTQKAASKKRTDVFVLSNSLLREINGVTFVSGKSNGVFKDESSCAIYTEDTTIKPHVRTLDYGTGCVSSDGVVRKGKIVAYYDNEDFRKTNNHLSIQFQNFWVDSVQITGGADVTNTGPNGSGNPVFVESMNIQAVEPAGSDSLTANYSYEWTQGQTSDPLSNLQFVATGSAVATNHLGYYSSLNITSPIVRNYATPGCNYIIQGTVFIHTAGEQDQTIDFGNGTCTGLETVTVNGVSTTKSQPH